ncbi:hypothetical protein [uncultured Megamonas sp.]|uniref:hypothetical protein n=1 Tax=uncultured Megamonas sp. TaxID=286140 RepID=UPI00259B53AF|nr:hypothetical protein [uncultured Megamonas sp.]
MTIKDYKVLKTFVEENKTIEICEDNNGYHFIKTEYHVPVQDQFGGHIEHKTFYNFNYEDEPLNILIYRYKNDMLDLDN